MNHEIWLHWLGILCAAALSSPAVLAQETSSGATSQQFAWELGPTGSQTSLRGLSAPNDETIWACGSAGTVLRSTDGGSGWIECGPDDFANLDFRSIHGWDARAACIASAGTPAVILKTNDAGATWREVYRHPSPTAFFDGLKFFDEQRGVAFGDPIDGVFCIVESFDGGEQWQTLASHKLPAALPGEAAFAASNSAMFIADSGQIWIGTGGRVADTSRLLWRETWLAPWKVTTCPLLSSDTAGIFSITGSAKQHTMVAVGGNYRADKSSTTTAALSTDRGRTWRLATDAPASFCSAVVCLKTPDGVAEFFIATGPEGSYRSSDGRRWEKFSTNGFHCMAKSPTKLFATGSDGRFARLNW